MMTKFKNLRITCRGVEATKMIGGATMWVSPTIEDCRVFAVLEDGEEIDISASVKSIEWSVKPNFAIPEAKVTFHAPEIDVGAVPYSYEAVDAALLATVVGAGPAEELMRVKKIADAIRRAPDVEMKAHLERLESLIAGKADAEATWNPLARAADAEYYEFFEKHRFVIEEMDFGVAPGSWSTVAIRHGLIATMAELKTRRPSFWSFSLEGSVNSIVERINRRCDELCLGLRILQLEIAIESPPSKSFVGFGGLIAEVDREVSKLILGQTLTPEQEAKTLLESPEDLVRAKERDAEPDYWTRAVDSLRRKP